MPKNKILNLLKKYKIPYQNWCEGTSKPLSKFFEEIKNGEAKLEEKDGQLIRIVSLIVLNVFYQENNQKYHLIESKQIYKNGRIVERHLPDSIHEKLFPNEDPFIAAKRALKEELGIETELEIIQKGISKNQEMGKSYPGLINQSTEYNYEVTLTKKEYKKAGYEEHQPDKTNYFKWKKIKK